MDEREDSPQEHLKQKYPDLVLGTGAPSLFTLNGVGLAMYGRRDHDPETNTYVKTRFLVVLFVPVLALGAYRVSDASNGGWYFIGRHPLSGVCKILNLGALAAVLFVAANIAWLSYSSTPEYKAAQKLQKARDLREQGQALPALHLYALVHDGPTPSSAEAAAESQALFAEALPRANPAEAKALILFALQRAALKRELMVPENLRSEVLKLAEGHSLRDPRAARELLKAASALDPDGSAFAQSMEKFLKAAVAKQPGDLGLAAELAELHVSREEWAAARALLEPHAAKLSGQEAARVLGQVYVREGDFEKALPLLKGYATKRLEALHAAQKRYDTARDAAFERNLAQLKGGAAPQDWYESYERAGEARKEQMFQAWMAPRMQADGPLREAEAALDKVSNVVPVALDLGIVLLRQAQGQEGAQRQASLEEAEQVFLAIGGVAGETDAYRIFYAQVLYWLGKHEEGEKLLDEFLASKTRDVDSLGQVAAVCRSVGEETKSRALYEEAYEKADEETKKGIAGARAVLSKDDDERLMWLERCDARGVTVQAEIAAVKGRKALRAGDEAAAEKLFREAIRGYESVPSNDTVLNNTAIFYHELFELTGAREDHEKYASLHQAALKLDPDDSIHLANTAGALESSARLAVFAARFDLRALRRVPDYGDLGLLYADEAGRQETLKPLIEHPLEQRALEFCRRLTIVAPHSPSGYAMLAGLLALREDLPGLKELEAQLERSGFTPEDSKRRSLEYYAGEKQAEHRAVCAQFAEIKKKRLEALPKDAAPATRAALHCDLIELKLALHKAGGETDPDEVVGLAEEAGRLCPSSHTNNKLIAAYLHRLLVRLAQQDSAFNAYLVKHGRALTGIHGLVFVLRKPAWREALAAQPDFARVADLMRVSYRAFPKRVSGTDWGFFHFAGLPEAAEAQAAFQSDERSRIVQRLNLRLSPLAADHILDEVLWLEAHGKKEEALKVLREAAEAGVPVPVE